MSKQKSKHPAFVLAESVQQKIIVIRGRRVMLDRDLAELYKIPTGALNQAVSRNPERFPEDFMMRLNAVEYKNLISQSVISSWGGSRILPRVFTEHGILMLSSVLSSERAIRVNIGIMRAYMKMRQLANTHEDLKRKIEEMERKYDSKFKAVFDALREILAPPVNQNKRPIGFHAEPASPPVSSKNGRRFKRA